MSGVRLTFDDGPDPVWTPRLLDILAEAGARATFFPIAPRAVVHADVIERMLAEGHAIGLHCGEHVRHRDLDPTALAQDTDAALGHLAGLGVTPRLWRTPWGDTTPATYALARERGLRVVGWTADSHDWRGDRAERMLAATRDAIVAGAIILAHDGLGPGARRDEARETMRYVALVAAVAARRGLTLEPLAHV